MNNLSLRFKNFLSSVGILSFFYLFYGTQEYFKNYFTVSHDFVIFSYSFNTTTFEVFNILFYIYIFCLLIFYFTENNPGVSKSIYAIRGLGNILSNPVKSLQDGIKKEEKIGLLSIIVKVFFIPLMISWLLDHTSHMVGNLTIVVNSLDQISSDFIGIFKSNLFWLLFQTILFLDVFFFTIGYLVELPVLNNKIRSVDGTILGWTVALMCYPPFNGAVGEILKWQSTDFPFFENVYLFVILNMLLLVLMSLYTYASISLNFKASNLTHRGIVETGPYKYIRHPAYICKNTAWWIGAIPLLVISFNTGVLEFIIAFSSMLGWTYIYFLRAITEENHLKSVDGDYEKYCEKVRCRFIPGLL